MHRNTCSSCDKTHPTKLCFCEKRRQPLALNYLFLTSPLTLCLGEHQNIYTGRFKTTSEEDRSAGRLVHGSSPCLPSAWPPWPGCRATRKPAGAGAVWGANDMLSYASGPTRCGTDALRPSAQLLGSSSYAKIAEHLWLMKNWGAKSKLKI